MPPHGVSQVVRWDGERPVVILPEMRVVIAEERCKGCGLCVAACPPEVLVLGALNSRGYPAAKLIDNDRCTSCAVCAQVCPDSAIAVFKPPRPARREAAA